jgi:RHS repeat-associated protein
MRKGKHGIQDSSIGRVIAVNESYSGTSKTPAYDHAGNMIDDGTFVYVYDAWSRLVKVRSKESANVTLQTAKVDGLGRRIKKVVTSSGDFDKTEVYFYDGQQVVQINNGSGTMVQQFIHGTQYIDELVMVRVADKGDFYVHQDGNWNVIGLTDLGRHVVERYVYTPYGELIVHQDTGFGDRDGDGDVDSTDKGTVGTTCTGTVSGSCRILDLDFDGDYDSTDATKFDALTQGAMRHPGRPATNVSQPFAHQGLLFEPELAQYQNRARQYDPGKRRFVQEDPLFLSPSRHESHRPDPNLYEYIRSTPLVKIDPFGLMIVCGGPLANGDELCCWPYSNWVDDRGYAKAAVTFCCGTSLLALSSGCAPVACLNPSFFWHSPAQRKCTIEHECQHVQDKKCTRQSVCLCNDTSALTREQKECRAHCVGLKCHISAGPPYTIYDHNDCGYNRCIAKRVCSGDTIDHAVDVCSTPPSSGCDDPMPSICP